MNYIEGQTNNDFEQTKKILEKTSGYFSHGSITDLTSKCDISLPIFMG